MKNNILTIAFFVLLAACSQIPKEAYYERGRPESLLDSSSEIVNVNLRSHSSIQQLSRWINRDQPSRAEMHCVISDPLCSQAKYVLAQFAVPVKMTVGARKTISLVYDRVVARDCENRYIDNHINPYELSHPTFGCSVTSNLVQMVSDKRQFTSPALMGDSDADKAVQAVDAYHKPNTYSPFSVNMNSESLLQSIQTSAGTSSR